MTEPAFPAEEFWSSAPQEAEDACCPEGETDSVACAASPSAARVRRASWMDDELRPRVFTPPPSRSAVQSHRTTADAAGQPLPPRARARMERALGGDLSRARVHMQSAVPGDDERELAVTRVLARLLDGR